MGLKEQNKLKIELFGAGLVGPRGLKGDKGDPGEKGEKGDRGERGLKGDPGTNMPQEWVDEITLSSKQYKIDIADLKDKDEQIAQTFQEVRDLIGELDIDGIEFNAQEIKTVTNTIKKVQQKLKTFEDTVSNTQQKILELEDVIENGSQLENNDEIIITNDAQTVTAKVVIETKDDVSNILLNNKEDVLKLSTDNVLFKEMNDGVEELIALTNLIRNNKEEFELVKGLIGDLSELSTENKQNVMESLNEVCAISQMAVSRLEYDSETKTLRVYDYHGLNDEIIFE